LNSESRFDTAAAKLAVGTHSHLWTGNIYPVEDPMKLDGKMTFDTRPGGNLFTT
jgi:hypothetical protein